MDISPRITFQDLSPLFTLRKLTKLTCQNWSCPAEPAQPSAELPQRLELGHLTAAQSLSLWGCRAIAADAMFGALMRMTSLTGLDVKVTHRPRSLPSLPVNLSHLSNLQQLELRLASLDVLSYVTQLTGLTALTLDTPRGGAFLLADVVGVLSLPKLESLSLSHVDAAFDTSTSDAAVSATCAVLRTCTTLTKLSLGNAFQVTGRIAPVIWGMSRLTALSVGRLEPSVPAVSGCLPQLQHLSLGCLWLTPLALLHVLAPLAPVPSLTMLRHGAFDVTCRSDADAVIQLEALGQVLTTLRDAPRLRHAYTDACFNADTAASVGLTCRQVLDVIHATGIAVSEVEFRGVALLPALHVPPPSRSLDTVTRLGIHDTVVDDSGLAALLDMMPALMYLSMYGCSGMSDESWLRFSAARAMRFTLSVWNPELNAELVERCREAQRLAFGQVSIKFTHSS